MRLVLVVLLVFPALAGCASGGGLTAEQQSEFDRLRTDLDDAYARLDAAQMRVGELERSLGAQGENRPGERGETVALLPTDVFFESGSAELTPEGVRALVEVAERLRTEFRGRALRIEGYTDANPIGPNLRDRYPSNWELSAARAAMVARHLQWTHNFDGGNIEVVGLGEYHPLADNATAEGREENRRVRIAVMPD